MADKVAKGRQTKGVECHAAKLNDDLVRYIREVYSPGCRVFGAKALAVELGVNYYTIMSVITGKSWKHVER